MKCWICLFLIGDGEFSRDHEVPRTVEYHRRVGQRGSAYAPRLWRPAHKRCNTARGDMTIEQVEAVRARMPEGYSSFGLEMALRIEARETRLTRARKRKADKVAARKVEPPMPDLSWISKYAKPKDA